MNRLLSENMAIVGTIAAGGASGWIDASAYQQFAALFQTPGGAATAAFSAKLEGSAKSDGSSPVVLVADLDIVLPIDAGNIRTGFVDLNLGRLTNTKDSGSLNLRYFRVTIDPDSTDTITGFVLAYMNRYGVGSQANARYEGTLG